jgi:hypothetical protein
MKRAILIVALMAAALLACQAMFDSGRPDAVTSRPESGTAEAAASYSAAGYVVVGWNSLGMHCLNPSFKTLCILPPYNTLMVQVIRRGNPPRVVTTGLKLEYAVDQNTKVKGKTDFWQYEKDLFGVNLTPGIGLAGFGLSGNMVAVAPPNSAPGATPDHFEAIGIPLLPYNDRMVWNPYQTATVRLKTTGGGVLATTTVTLPVSDELHCEMCHAQGGDAFGTSPDVDVNILQAHDRHDLAHHLEEQVAQTGKPVLCASCHADKALGIDNQTGDKILSEAMHGWHSTLGDDSPACYSCHPGPQTHCNRSAIVGMGRESVDDPGCEKCHGTLANMAQSIRDGRRPWQDEPTCAQCHGANYNTGEHLYRESTGPCGLMCCTCHNSPHAWWPSRLAMDNKQPLQTQGTPYSMGANCWTCHTTAKVGDSPHVRYDFRWP